MSDALLSPLLKKEANCSLVVRDERQLFFGSLEEQDTILGSPETAGVPPFESDRIER